MVFEPPMYSEDGYQTFLADIANNLESEQKEVYLRSFSTFLYRQLINIGHDVFNEAIINIIKKLNVNETDIFIQCLEKNLEDEINSLTPEELKQVNNSHQKFSC